MYYSYGGVGDHITGDNVANTPIKICTKKLSRNEQENFKWLIDQDYTYTYFVDQLPSAFVSRKENTATVKYENGITIGSFNAQSSQYYLYNHLEITIQVHETLDDQESFRIVGFKVEPQSMKQDFSNPKKPRCQSLLKQQVTLEEDIVFTYSVRFEKSEIQWASRWDHYLQMGEDSVHWVSIINSFMIVIILAGLIAHIMSKALKRDISQYEAIRQKQQEKLKKIKRRNYAQVSQNENTEESKEVDEEKEPGAKSEDEFVLDEIAWKKVKGEVFKKPKCSLLFSVLVGTGAQILAMVVFFLIFALLGIVTPQHRGTLVSAVYFFFIILSNISGYYAARFYKMFQGTNWLACAIQLFELL